MFPSFTKPLLIRRVLLDRLELMMRILIIEDEPVLHDAGHSVDIATDGLTAVKRGLNVGVDDCVTKPFGARESAFAINGRGLRQRNPEAPEQSLAVAHIQCDSVAHLQVMRHYLAVPQILGIAQVPWCLT